MGRVGLAAYGLRRSIAVSVDVVQARLICVALAGVAVRLAGAVGGVVSGGGDVAAARKATICATHAPVVSAAVAL